MNIRENHKILIKHHPHYQSLNKKLIEDSNKAEYSRERNNCISAEMTGYRISSKSIDLVLDWIDQLVYNDWGYERQSYKMDILDAWFVRYDKGNQTISHHHRLNILSFVYFVDCPKGSSPLVFSTSGKRIKAEEGKLVLFPGNLLHHVPKNGSKGRLVLAGNIFFSPIQRTPVKKIL